MPTQMTISSNPEERLLRLSAVLARFPVSRSHWYQGIADGRFPKPVKLSANVVAWRASDIETLIAQLSNESEAHNG